MAGARVKLGRPTDYTPELATRICEQVATTSKSMADICEANPDFPAETNVFKWMLRHPTFRQEYLEAKEIQGLVYSERVMRDAYNCAEVNESIAKANHVFRVTQWHLSKLAPKRFGDKQNDTQTNAATSEQVKEIADAVKQLNNKHERDY